MSYGFNWPIADATALMKTAYRALLASKHGLPGSQGADYL